MIDVSAHRITPGVRPSERPIQMSAEVPLRNSLRILKFRGV